MLTWTVGCDGDGGSSEKGGSAGSAGSDGGKGGTGAAGGDGGAGGATGGTGGSTDTGTTSSTDTGTTSSTDTGTTSTTATGSLCEQLCAVGKQAGCYNDPEATCIAGCEGQYAEYPQCASQMDAAWECAIDAVPQQGCDLDSACPAEAAAVSECVGGASPNCELNECAATPTMCSCTGPCNGVTLQVDCQQGAGGVLCKCYENNNLVGTCTDSDLGCGIGGCCADYFPTP